MLLMTKCTQKNLKDPKQNTEAFESKTTVIKGKKQTKQNKKTLIVLLVKKPVNIHILWNYLI